jgi:PPOX class probable F420-dependent enzyme
MPTLSPDEARRRFGAAPVARLATVRPDGRPHLVPIVFVLDGERIVTIVDSKPKRSSDLQRLRNIRVHPAVSVLVDHYEDEWRRLWWVRADGRARVIEAGPEHETAIGLLTTRYPPYRAMPPSEAVVVIEVRDWTGWAAYDGP